MIKNFENKYGNPNKTIMVVGDYDKGDNNMKGKEPTICKNLEEYLKMQVIKHIWLMNLEHQNFVIVVMKK